jgi:hypothetical protein
LPKLLGEPKSIHKIPLQGNERAPDGENAPLILALPVTATVLSAERRAAFTMGEKKVPQPIAVRKGATLAVL